MFIQMVRRGSVHEGRSASMSGYKVTPAPEPADMERWSPVVLVDKYEYGACGNCCPCRGRSTYLCGTCCICPLCCCALPDEVFPLAPTHIKNRKDVLGSFATGGDGKAGLIAWKLVRHDDPDWKTELYGECVSLDSNRAPCPACASALIRESRLRACSNPLPTGHTPTSFTLSRSSGTRQPWTCTTHRSYSGFPARNAAP